MRRLSGGAIGTDDDAAQNSLSQTCLYFCFTSVCLLQSRVESLLVLLGMRRCATTVVGGGLIRGVSGERVM